MRCDLVRSLCSPHVSLRCGRRRRATASIAPCRVFARAWSCPVHPASGREISCVHTVIVVTAKGHRSLPPLLSSCSSPVGARWPYRCLSARSAVAVVSPNSSPFLRAVARFLLLSSAKVESAFSSYARDGAGNCCRVDCCTRCRWRRLRLVLPFLTFIAPRLPRLCARVTSPPRVR